MHFFNQYVCAIYIVARKLIAALAKELKQKDSEIQELKQNITSLENMLKNDLAIKRKHSIKEEEEEWE
jgi:hypothetical protein